MPPKIPIRVMAGIKERSYINPGIMYLLKGKRNEQ
jgi:hypothetical protein